MSNSHVESPPYLQIGDYRCSRLNPALMIAEEGQANEGNFDLALRMIELAAKCGADGIEFQLSIASDLYVYTHNGFALYKQREFTEDMIEKLISTTHAKGMVFQAACLSDKLIGPLVAMGADVLVLNATDLNNPHMLDTLADCGKPFLIATLMGTIEEIDWAVARVRSRHANEFALLHGQHIMASKLEVGVPVEYTQLDCITMLEQRYGVPVGFVDHTDSEIMPAIAASRGAVIVTKHLSPKPDWRGPDWQVCLHPKSWKRAYDHCQYANAARGADKTLNIEEIEDRSQMRRSIVAANNIPSGKILAESDIAFKRPGGGLDPRHADRYVGRRVKESVMADQMLSEEVFE
ncbi:MAG: hypothetical protein GY845_34770 [Planctomycetes bacterium]|nr:hypothetical protein [Planctomycetota bacterium]